jgi:aryl-alcohol dehydrogenase-like predicted oxidoreductase
MESTHLGETGLVVSRIGLGTAAIGRPGYINVGHATDLEGHTTVDGLRRRAWDMLDAARSAGITYIDTARSYGRGEEFVAAWLGAGGAADARSDMVVGSKWGYTYTADWAVDAAVHEVKDHSVAKLDEQVVRSRSLLGNHLRIYQIHSATEASGVLDNADVISRLADLRDGGLKIGLTTTGPEQATTIRKAASLSVGGRRLFDTVQTTWNLLEPSAGDALSEARAAGLGVIVKEAVANGRLTGRDPRIAAVIRRHTPGSTPDAVALAAALHLSPADLVLSGAATVQQLSSNLHAVDVPEAVVSALPDLAEPTAQYWATRSELAWT